MHHLTINHHHDADSALSMLSIQLNEKHHKQEAAQSGCFVVQSDLIVLLDLADLYHGITQ